MKCHASKGEEPTLFCCIPLPPILIVEKIAKFEQIIASTEHVFTMGRQYRLKVIYDSESNVKLLGKYITVVSPYTGTADTVKSLLNEWYRIRAEAKLPEIVDRCSEKFKAFGILRPEIKFKVFSKRWGSCTQQGRMWLNVDLIKAPLACIEYVITHELCHQKEHNHGKEFFRLLNKIMPDWQKRKERLERVMSGI
jgi:predicted metal-dependent hydrolase